MPEPTATQMTAKTEAERNQESLRAQMDRYAAKGIRNPSLPAEAGAAEVPAEATATAAPADERTVVITHAPATKKNALASAVPPVAAAPKEGE